MMTHGRRLVAAAFMGATVLLTPVSAASAQTTVGDGLINVAVGDITVQDAIDVGVAASVAAQLCGLEVGPVAVLGSAVDRGGPTETVCTSTQGPVRLVQNSTPVGPSR
jgi:hypothetical protein